MVFIEIFKIQYVGGRGVSIRALPTCGGAKAFLLIEDILSLPLVEDPSLEEACGLRGG